MPRTATKTDYSKIVANGVVHTLAFGDVVRVDTDTEHFYFIDLEYYPSVNQILDQSAPIPYGLIEYWKNNTKQETEEALTLAGDIGSNVHDACQMLIKAVPLHLNRDYKTKREKKALVAFRNWFIWLATTYQILEIETELTVVSKRYKYAGTLDIIILLINPATGKKERWLIDIKTSKNLSYRYEAQVVAYKQAYFESYRHRVDKMFILQVGTLHKIGYKFEQVDRPYSAFDHLYQTFLNLNNGKIPEPKEIEVYPDILRLYDDRGVLVIDQEEDKSITKEQVEEAIALVHEKGGKL